MKPVMYVCNDILISVVILIVIESTNWTGQRQCKLRKMFVCILNLIMILVSSFIVKKELCKLI